MPEFKSYLQQLCEFLLKRNKPQSQPVKIHGISVNTEYLQTRLCALSEGEKCYQTKMKEMELYEESVQLFED